MVEDSVEFGELQGVENVSVVQGRMMATSLDLTNAFAQFTVRGLLVRADKSLVPY